MEGSDLRAPLSVRGRREPQPSRHIAVERVAERVGEVQRDEPRPPQRLRLSRSPEEAGRRSTASCNSRQSARWRRSAPSRSAADFRALAVCWFIPASSRLAGEHDGLPTVRGLVVAKDVDGTVVPADLEVAVVGAVPAIDDLEHLDAAAAQFEPAWGLLAAVAGVAVDVDVHGHSVPREWAADHIAVGGEFGTLSEIDSRRRWASPVVGIDSWELSRQGRRAEAISRAAGPEEAVAFALPLAARPGGLTPRPNETNCRRGVEHATSQRRKG